MPNFFFSFCLGLQPSCVPSPGSCHFHFVSSSAASLLLSLSLTIFFVSLCQTMQCHNKTAHDFVFVGSSSLIATAGLSTDNRYKGVVFPNILSTCIEFFTSNLKLGSLVPRYCEQQEWWSVLGWRHCAFVTLQERVSVGHSGDSC